MVKQDKFNDLLDFCAKEREGMMNPTPERQLEIANECGATENGLSIDGAWNVCKDAENYELKQAIQVQAMQLEELQAKLTKVEQQREVAMVQLKSYEQIFKDATKAVEVRAELEHKLLAEQTAHAEQMRENNIRFRQFEKALSDCMNDRRAEQVLNAGSSEQVPKKEELKQ